MASPSTQFSDSYIHESIGGRLVGVSSAFIALETLFYAAQVFSRRLQKTYMPWADGCMVIAYVFNVALCVTGIVVVQYGGAGRHFDVISTLEPQLIPIFYKTIYMAGPVIYCVAVTFPKLAILDIYLHVFIERWQRICCWIVAAIITLNMVVNIPTVIWQCSPTAYLWDKNIPGGWCNDLQKHYLLASVPNIVTDVAMLVLPLPMIRKLQASRRVKWGLSATFLAGSIGLITSIVRFVIFDRPYTDATAIAVTINIWTIVEPGMYVIAACSLTYRPLIRYLVSESFLSRYFTTASLLPDRLTPARKDVQAEGNEGRHSVGSTLRSSSREDSIEFVDMDLDAENSRAKRAKHGGISVEYSFEITAHQV